MHEILAETDRKRSKMPFNKVRQYYFIKGGGGSGIKKTT